MMTLEEYRATIKYLDAVEEVARQTGLYLSQRRLLDLADELIKHGEPAEGVRYLAWAIVEEQIKVPGHLIDSIYELSSELIDVEDLPQNLRDYAAPENPLDTRDA